MMSGPSAGIVARSLSLVSGVPSQRCGGAPNRTLRHRPSSGGLKPANDRVKGLDELPVAVLGVPKPLLIIFRVGVGESPAGVDHGTLRPDPVDY